MRPATSVPEIFVSYRRQDSAGHVGWLYAELEECFGHEHVFRDLDSIQPGDRFPQALEASLERMDVMLVMIGAEWLDERNRARLHRTDDYVRREVASALARPDVRVIPVLVAGASQPDAAALPRDLAALTARQSIELRDSRWDDDVAHLVELLGGRSDPPAPRRWIRVLVGAAAAVAVAGLAVVLWPGGDPTPAAVPASAPTSPSSVATPTPTPSSTRSDAPTSSPSPSPTTSPSPSPSPPAGSSNVPGADDIRINFQRRNAEVPAGYLVDYGQPYGEQPSGLSYGWVEPGTSTPKDMTAHARDRDVVDDQLRDTLMHFRNFNPATNSRDVGAWELGVPDGRYLVRVMVGEPTINDQHNTVVAEGVPVVTDFVSSRAGTPQEDNLVTVTVDDGRLTLSSDPDTVTKITFVEVERLG